MDARRICLIAWIAGIALAPAGWTSTARAQAPSTQPTTQPSADAAPPSGNADPSGTIRFQFDGEPTASVVRRFAQAFNKPLIAQGELSGTITFFDAATYTYDQALDTLNIMLAMRGHTLIEDGRFLRLVPLGEIKQMPVPILRGLDDRRANDVRPGQVVTVVLPLKFIDAQSASKAVTAMVSSFGYISPMVKGKGLIITDRMENIRRIRRLLAELDTEGLIPQQMKTRTLANVSARSAAEMINKLFSGKKDMVFDPRVGRYVARLDQTNTVTASYDERTNTVLLLGAGDRMTLAEQLLSRLDDQQGSPSSDLRIFRLTSANADSLAETVTEAINGPPKRDKRGKPIPQPDAVRVVADEGTNRLVVSAPVDRMAAVEQLIAELDQAATESGSARIFRLKSADAQQLAEIVAGAAFTTDKRGKKKSTLNVTADPRNNALIVAGAAGDIEIAARLIDELDRPADAESREIHVVALETGDARQVARSLVNLFQRQSAGRGRGKSASSLRVEADRGTNSLMISAAPADWPIVQDILAKLNASAADSATITTRRVPLAHAQAAEMARTLERMFGRRSRRRGQSPVTIAPSEPTNSLLISASAEDHEVIAGLVESLDVEASDTARPIRMIRLEAAQAEELVQRLQTMIPRPPRGRPREVYLRADPRTNSVLLRAPEAKRQLLEDTIARLDKAATESARETRIVNLQHTSAGEMAAMITQLYPDAAGGSRRRRRSSEPDDGVVLSPAPGDRTLVIDAPRARMQAIVTLIETLDTDTSPGARQVRTYQLTHSDARELARSLGRMFAERRRSRGRSDSASQPPRFEADRGTNQLLVSATAAQFETIEELVKELTSATTLARQTRTFELEHAKADDVLTLLQTVLNVDPRRRGRGGPDEIRLAAMGATNAIVMQAPPEQLQLAQSLVTQFDVPDAESAGVIRIIELTNAKAESVAEKLQTMIPRPRRGQPQEVFVVADAVTNSVLLRAPADQRAMLEEMVSKLDQASAVASREMRIIRLKSASASQLSVTLGQLYSAQQGRSRRRRRSTDDPQAVTITAAPGDRTLLVEAPADKLKEIAQLVAELDSDQAPGAMQVRTYDLAGGNARQLARSMGRLFTERRRGRGQPASNEPQPRFEAGPADRQLIVAATAGQFETIDKLVAELTTSATMSRETRTFHLKHARADELSPVIESVLTGSTGRRRRGGDQDIRIEAVRAANSIIIQAPADAMDQAERLLAEFDTPDAGGQSVVKIIALNHAQAPAVAEALGRMIPRRRRGRSQDVFIHADELTNSILLRAPAAQRQTLEAMIAQLDSATAAQVREQRVVELSNASASSVAVILGELYGDGSSRRRRRSRTPDPDRVVISAAAGDRTLIIEAPKDKLESMLPLIARLDSEQTPGQIEVRTYQLAENAARDVARSLGRLFRQQRRGRPDATAPEPRFEANESANQLMVAATAAQFAEIEPLITKVQTASVQSGQTRTFQLTHAKVDEMAGILTEMLEADRRRRGGGPAVRVAAMPSAQALVVQAPPAKMALAEQLIRQFDSEQAAEASSVEVVQLANADARSLAEAVSATLAGRSDRRRRRGQSTGGQVAVTPEDNSNSLLVRGPAPGVAEAVALIKQLDSESTPSQVAVRVFPLNNSEATELADSLGRMFRDILRQQSRNRRGRGQTPFAVTADERTNSLVVSTTPAHFAIVETLLGRLDKADKTITDVEYIWLDNADATTVATQLEAMYRDRRGKDKPVIEPDLFANALTLIARDADLRAMRRVVDRLDEAAKDNNLRVRVVPLSDIRAQNMAEVLRRVYGQMTESEIVVTDEIPDRTRSAEPPALPLHAPDPNADPNEASSQAAVDSGEGMFQPEPKPTVTIAVDRKANALIISATRRELENIEMLIAQLAMSTEDAEPDLRVFKVNQADPASVAETLDKLFNPKAPQADKKKKKAAPETKPSVVVVANEATRHVIVRARPTDFELIEPLIAQLDRSSTVTSELRVFPLVNTEADGVADSLRELLRVTPAPAKNGKKKKGQDVRAEQIRQLIELRTADGVARIDTSEQVSISANAGTNSVMVVAPAEAMDLVGRLIQELDQSAARTTLPVVRMYPLDHAQVEPTVGALRELFAQGGRGKAGPLREKTVITGDAAGGLVIVSAPADRHELVATVIDEMDAAQAADSVTVKVYRVKHADAAGVAGALQQTIAGATGGRRRRGQDDAGGVRITADRSSNSIVVRASADEHERIAELIAEADTSPTEGMPVRLIALNHADPQEMAGTLSRLFGADGSRRRRGGGPPVVIEADRDARMLMVRCDDDTFERVRAMAAKLDTASPAGQVSQTILPLTHARAADVAGSLQQVFGPGRRWWTQPEGEEVSIIPEPASNSLIVKANEKNLAKVKELLAKLDTPDAGGVRTEMLLLRHAKAGDLAQVLAGVGGGDNRRRGRRGSTGRELTVSAEESSNALVIIGPSKDVETVMKMALELDKASESTAAVEVKMYPVQRAEVASVAQALERVLASLPGRETGRRGRGRSGGSAVVADETAKVVIVSAPAKQHELVAKVIADLDSAAGSGDVLVKVYKLQHAQSWSAANALANAMDAETRRTRRGQGGGSLRISPDNSSNALVVRGTEAEHKEVAELIAELDVPSAGQQPVRVIALNHADADQLAQTLARLFNASSGWRRRGEGTVIEADTSARMLLVRADDETFEKIREMAAKLDTASPAGQTTQTILALEHARAVDVAGSLQRVFGPGRRWWEQSPNEEVEIIPEPTSNSLIVKANEKNLARVKELLAKLDTPAAGGARTELLVLKSARAEDLARVLSSVAGGGSRRGRRRQPAGATPVISAESASNALVITGPARDVEELTQMALKLDQAAEDTAEVVVRTYPVANVDVPTAVDALEQILRSRAQATGGRRGRGRSTSAVIGDQAAGRLIVSAAAAEHELIAQVVKDLDTEATGQEVTVKVYRLEHGDAASAARALDEAVRKSTGRRRSSTDPLRITADRGSNSLVVRAARKDHATLAELIEQIDAPTVAQHPVQTIPLTHADADEVARVLSRLFGLSDSRRRGRYRGQAAGESILIEPSGDARMLMVRADDETMEKIRSVAQRLDVYPAGRAMPTLLPVPSGQAATLAASLSAAFAPPRGRRVQPDEVVTVVAEPTSSNLIVTANEANLQRVKALLGKLTADQAGGIRTEFLLLKNAKAEELARSLGQVAAATSGGTSRRGRRGQPTGQALTVTADESSNALILSGPAGDLDELMKMAIQLDQATESTIADVFVIPLTSGDAVTTAAMVRDMYNQQAQAARRDRKDIDPLAVSADARANAVVLATTKKMHEQVTEWIGQVERMTPARGRPVVIPLKRANPAEVEKAIQQLYNPTSMTGGNRRGRRGRGAPAPTGGAGSVETTVLEDQQAIMVTGSQEDVEAIGKLVEALEAAAEQARQEVKIFPLAHANNLRVAAALTQMFRQAGRSARPDEQVTVTALQQTNAVVVSATTERMAEVAGLIAQLDREEISPQLEFRIYPLEHAQPTKIVPVLRTMLQQVVRLKPGETIDVQADERTRSIIITAKADLFAQIEKTIRVLDQPPAFATADVRVIPLKKADAVRLASVLNEMLRPSATGQVTPEARALQEQVRRLRVTGEGGEDLPELDLTKPIKITSDPAQSGAQGSNSLIVTSTGDNLKALAAVVELMDTIPLAEGVRVRLMHLAHADAEAIQQVLRDIFSQGLQRLAGKPGTSVAGKAQPESTVGKALTNVLNVSVDMRTNTVVLAGVEETLTLAEMIVKDLDREGAKIVAEVRLVPLDHAESATLAATLQRMMDARVQAQRTLSAAEAEKLRVVLAADERSNTLIVVGAKESYELVAELARRLDSAEAALQGQVKLLPLTEANAGNVAATLSNLFDQRYQAARTDEMRRRRPIILPDLRTNSLLVAAGKDDTAVIASLLKQLDVELTDPAVRLVVLPLEHNDATSVGRIIEEIFQARLAAMTAAGQTPSPADKVDVAVDTLSNALVVSASKENLELIDGLLAKVDIAPAVESGLVKMFALRNADAQRVLSMLQGLMSQGLYKPQAVSLAGNPALAAREKVALAVDARTNVLIVSASKENLGVIERIIERVDDPDSYQALSDIRVVPLQRAEAERLAPSLQQFFDRKLAAEQQAAGGDAHRLRVTIIPDARTNTLLVAGGREAFGDIAKMIEQLDVEQTVASAAFEVIPLTHATAGKVREMLQQLFAQRVSRGVTKDPVTVLADAQTNSLIIGASADDLALAKGLVNRLDVPAPEAGKTLHVFPLTTADATQVAETLRTLYTSQSEAASLSVDERINAIVVSAGAAEVERLAGLIEQLDRKEVTKVTEIRVMPLNNADATELAGIITEVLTGTPEGPGPANPNRQTLLQFIASIQGGREKVTSALQEGVLITPDARSNALVVAAPSGSMSLLDSMVQALDSTSPRIAEIRVFTLDNADASSMAEILTQLFQLQQTGGGTARSVKYTLVAGREAKPPATGEADGEASATVGTAEQYALSVTVDPRTNSLLVGGTKAYVQLCSSVIEELDSCPGQERQTRVYRLRHAQSANIEAAIQGFLDQEREKLVSTLGSDRLGAVRQLLDREVTIVAEETSNKLLLSASPRYFETIARMIQELDQPSPEVLIQVLLAEVRLDNSEDLGVEWTYTDSSGNRTVNAGTDFSVQAAANLSGGFTVSVTASDLTMFLRALQTQGKLEVLSKLNMVASDNQESNLESGQRVPLITASRVTDQGDTINSIQYENIGILLAVTPRISADGFVKLDVAPEISSLSTSGVEIANGVRAPIINRRIARTTLTVQDGHTIIIGGLISTTDEIREDKMPLLGDLPLLGPLFRSTSRSKDRTELLIVLTPHILRTPMQAAEATRKEIENSLLLRSLKVRRLRQKAMDQLLRASDPNDPNAPARPSLPADDGPLSDPLDEPLPADPTEPAPIESEARPIRLDRLTDPQRLPARGKEAS